MSGLTTGVVGNQYYNIIIQKTRRYILWTEPKTYLTNGLGTNKYFMALWKYIIEQQCRLYPHTLYLFIISVLWENQRIILLHKTWYDTHDMWDSRSIIMYKINWFALNTRGFHETFSFGM